jgi:serine protease Do
MWRSLRFLSGLGVLLVCAAGVRADTLRITSTPAGATVVIEGVTVGTTPLEKEYPGGYFHRTKTLVGMRLDHELIAQVSLKDYITQEIVLTGRPHNWLDLHGRNHGEYFVFKAREQHVDLVPEWEATENIATKVSGSRRDRETGNGYFALSVEQLVERSKPAVVYLKGVKNAGSGFFVTETGLIVTNAHVANGEESFLATLATGRQLEAKVVYIDITLDFAFLRAPGNGFARLTFANANTVRQGETVIAIGNPGGAMQFSATRGIVSAVGQLDSAGPGIWIQTDTPMNPGNSGGPLLNMRGEVVGINTQKLTMKEGIGFALSSVQVVQALRKFLADEEPEPKTEVAVEKLSTPATSGAAPAEAFGTVFFSKPQGAEIRVDGNFAGEVPAKLKLTTGRHLIVIEAAGHAEWIKWVTVFGGSEQTLAPDW